MIGTYLPTFCDVPPPGGQKGRTMMNPISKEYLLLFNAITSAEETLSQLRESLIEAQRQAEELFLEEHEPGET